MRGFNFEIAIKKRKNANFSLLTQKSRNYNVRKQNKLKINYICESKKVLRRKFFK